MAARVTRKGRAAAEVLAESLPKEIAGLYWAKSMYWRGKSSERFVRPVRWLVAMLDGDVVPLEFAGIHAGNQSRGHRVLGMQHLKIRTAADYESTLEKANVIENSRALCEISFSEIKDVLKADKVLKPSSVVIDKGMSIKKAAERKSPDETFKSFEPLIVRQMARSALLLAHSWDEVYKAGGEPALSKYRSYLYPFTPDFIKPDYL